MSESEKQGSPEADELEDESAFAEFVRAEVKRLFGFDPAGEPAPDSQK